MNIIEFLEARIAEDEAAAQAASPGPWLWVGDPAEDEAFLRTATTDESVIGAYGYHTEGFIECSDADRAYIVRNNPARALAECAAKRAVVAVTDDVDAMDAQITREWGGRSGTADDILKTMAAVYADHPDYAEEWR